jgi:hypothetical protein
VHTGTGTGLALVTLIQPAPVMRAWYNPRPTRTHNVGMVGFVHEWVFGVAQK